jgi:hypothetical protein
MLYAAVLVYLLIMMFLWQISGNFALTMQRPEEVSVMERNLWKKNNAFSVLGMLLAQGMWIFALAYPIYWGITQSILQAILLLIVGNILAILFAGFFKRIFGVPEVILAYIGIAICPFLIIGIWFIRV